MFFLLAGFLNKKELLVSSTTIFGRCEGGQLFVSFTHTMICFINLLSFLDLIVHFR